VETIGRDEPIDNPDIQAGAAANQSLNRTDIIDGGPGIMRETGASTASPKSC
jgi:hypothetical protein